MKDVLPPRGEIAWVGYYNAAGKQICMLTSKPQRDYYYLYEVTDDGKLIKLGRARNPNELEEKFDVYRRMHATS